MGPGFDSWIVHTSFIFFIFVSHEYKLQIMLLFKYELDPIGDDKKMNKRYVLIDF